MATPREPQLFAYLSYVGAAAALDWLVAVGFEIVTRQEDPDGRVLHAEVRLGGVTLMIASADADYFVPPLLGTSTGAGLYLSLPEAAAVDDWYGRALGAGAHEVIAPENTPWGGRRARVLDPEGREWSVGDYRPGGS